MRAPQELQKWASSRLAYAQRGQGDVLATGAGGGGSGKGAAAGSGRGNGAGTGGVGESAGANAGGAVGESIGGAGGAAGGTGTATVTGASSKAFRKLGYAKAGFQSAVSSEPTGQTRVSPSKPGSFNSSSIPAGPCVVWPSCAKNRTNGNINYWCYGVISFYKIAS